jgi:hypothetical protein
MPTTYAPVYSLALTYGAHQRRFAVERVPNLGWHIREESDAQVIRQTTLDDWHRVELAIRAFDLQAAALTRRGWHRN